MSNIIYKKVIIIIYVNTYIYLSVYIILGSSLPLEYRGRLPRSGQLDQPLLHLPARQRQRADLLCAR